MAASAPPEGLEGTAAGEAAEVSPPDINFSVSFFSSDS